MRSKSDTTSTGRPANRTKSIAGVNHPGAGSHLETPKLRYAHRMYRATRSKSATSANRQTEVVTAAWVPGMTVGDSAATRCPMPDARCALATGQQSELE